MKGNDNIYNLDHMDYSEVDIICDIERLPFKPNSVDVFISNGVLEHITCGKAVVKMGSNKGGWMFRASIRCYPLTFTSRLLALYRCGPEMYVDGKWLNSLIARFSLVVTFADIFGLFSALVTKP